MSSVPLVNALLLASWAVLPLLLVGLIKHALAARRIQPELSLRKLESIELDRAVLLYGRVCARLQEFDAQLENAKTSWWARRRRRRRLRRQHFDELKDLETYARDLRATIIRLRRRPIQRFKAWIHLTSSYHAFRRSLVMYALVLAIMTGALYLFEQVPWRELMTGVDELLIWEPLDARLLYSNGVAASFVALAAPIFYVARLLRLHRAHRPQIRQLHEFAAADPDRLIRQSREERGEQEQPQRSEEKQDEPVRQEAADEKTWFAVLGVSPSASVDEVKEAYKALVKQSHPDRVHGMSAAFKELAEAETRKLNAAYEEAVTLLRSLEIHERAAAS